MTPTAEYSAMLYALADEIREQEGCVTASPEEIEDAAERMDVQTITIMAMLSLLERIKPHSSYLPSDVDDALHAALAKAKCYVQPEKTAKSETTVPAIIFYPAGSLGEAIEREGSAA